MKDSAAITEFDGATSKRLLDLEETGPGFQLVRVNNGSVKKDLLALNATYAIEITGQELSGWSIREWMHDLEQALDQSSGLRKSEGYEEIELLASRISMPRSIAYSSGTATISALAPPSSLVKAVKLSVARRFHRFSPFNPDRRVNPVTGDFLPGTYACPESEFPFIPTGFAAVGRLALPSPIAASHHYQIEALKDPKGNPLHVLFGTVTPAFGQAGGGVEALFPNGAKNTKRVAVPFGMLPDE